MIGIERVKQQLVQLKDAIKEQNRLDLLDLEPSEQELDDLAYLLGTIKNSIELLLPQTDAKQLAEEYSALLKEVESLPIDIDTFRIVEKEPVPETESIKGSLRSTPSPALRSSSPLEAPSVQKKVRFTESYRDNPDEGSAASDGYQTTVYATYEGNQELVLDQDRRLDELSRSVGRSRQQATEINGELGTHIDILDDLEAQVDRSEGRLGTARARVENFNRKAREGGSCLFIMCLTILLIILIII